MHSAHCTLHTAHRTLHIASTIQCAFNKGNVVRHLQFLGVCNHNNNASCSRIYAEFVLHCVHLAVQFLDFLNLICLDNVQQHVVLVVLLARLALSCVAIGSRRYRTISEICTQSYWLMCMHKMRTMHTMRITHAHAMCTHNTHAQYARVPRMQNACAQCARATRARTQCAQCTHYTLCTISYTMCFTRTQCVITNNLDDWSHVSPCRPRTRLSRLSMYVSNVLVRLLKLERPVLPLKPRYLSR